MWLYNHISSWRGHQWGHINTAIIKAHRVNHHSESQPQQSRAFILQCFNLVGSCKHWNSEIYLSFHTANIGRQINYNCRFTKVALLYGSRNFFAISWIKLQVHKNWGDALGLVKACMVQRRLGDSEIDHNSLVISQMVQLLLLSRAVSCCQRIAKKPLA